MNEFITIKKKQYNLNNIVSVEYQKLRDNKHGITILFHCYRSYEYDTYEIDKDISENEALDIQEFFMKHSVLII